MKRIILLTLALTLCPFTLQVQARTLQDLITEFRGTVGEVDSLNSNFNNALATFWINSGQDYVTTLFGSIERDTVYALTRDEGQFRFNLPGDFQSIFGVLRIDSVGLIDGALVRVPPDSFGLVADNKGSYYTFKKIIFIDATYMLEDDTVLVQFYGNAAALVTGTDVCAIEQNLQPFIMDYAISRYEWAKQFFVQGLQIRAVIKSDLADSRRSRIGIVQTE